MLDRTAVRVRVLGGLVGCPDMFAAIALRCVENDRESLVLTWSEI